VRDINRMTAGKTTFGANQATKLEQAQQMASYSKRNPHYQALAISLVWPTPLSYPVTKYLVSQEYNRDISLTTTILE
jgi:hypothetical protein